MLTVSLSPGARSSVLSNAARLLFAGCLIRFLAVYPSLDREIGIHFDGKGADIVGQHYKYPHDFKNHYVKQQYLPDALQGHTYYKFGDNKQEQSALMYRQKILSEAEE